jgi:hypothetical protein
MTTVARRRMQGADLFLGRVTRSLVALSLLVFAAWTLAYQVALALGVTVLPTVLVSVVVSVLVVLLALRLETPAGGSWSPSLPRTVPTLAATAVTGVALVLALLEQRALALLLGGVSGLVALVVIARRADRTATPDRDLAGGDGETPAAAASAPWRATGLWVTAWLGGLLSAYGSTRIARANSDDAYFVNLSSWVADRGSFPLNDTMISQDVFPANSAHSPPTHSVEALIGAVARLSGIEAGSITYLAVTPAVTLLGVLVLAWAVERARIPVPAIALLGALGYLWTTGGSGYSFGSFFAVRMWQGKAMLVSLAVPLLFILGAAVIRYGGARAHLLLGAAVIASVGLSNTSSFLTPVVLAAVAAGALALRQPGRAVGVALWSLYPLASGVVAKIMVPPQPSAAELAAEGFSTTPSTIVDPLATVPAQYGILAVTVVAIGLGALGMGNRILRATMAGAMVLTAVMLLPPVIDVLASVGLRSVTWRMWWVLPVPLLAAGVVGVVAGRVRRWTVPVALATALAVALVPLVSGRWVGAESPKTRIVSSTAWKVSPISLARAQYAQAISEPGDTVLLPADASQVLASLTVEMQPVSTRVRFLPTYAGTPEAHAGDRRVLQRFANRRSATPDDPRSLDDELDRLSVDTACVRKSREDAVMLLEGAGFTPVGSVRGLICLRR